jgi:3-deoxy-manno-octulosonate cytidylyltransferase (CMP-KDO synthetase)
MKIIGLIPVRLKSRRLKHKALLKISGYPLIYHTYKRALMSKLLDDTIVCSDSIKIKKILDKLHCKNVLTSKKHINGTERIAEVSKKIKSDLVVDIQGDEPLINPNHIDNLIQFHKKNLHFDIVVPSLKIKPEENQHIVKIVSDKKNNVLYFSRSTVPFFFNKREKYLQKHLSIISFKKEALLKFSKTKPSHLEKIEGIELMRALENNLKIGTFFLKGDSFSVDQLKDYERALIAVPNDRFTGKYIKKKK